jgi:hypothetical protein
MEMPSLPLVSLIIPTLNRGRYVLRAVDSCLRAADGTANVQVEVIVIDSQSDDGSWEMLLERFAQDSRVHLVQNQRGLGPTRSWLDGASLTKGEFATFVWSDDYISPRFLHVLLPLLQEDTELAVGSGAVRDVDDESEFAVNTVRKDLERELFLVSYFSGANHCVRQPASPICALFKRSCFDRWKHIVQSWCQATPLRKEIMWRRAIGPDLLLYLVAANTSVKIPTVLEVVAQFSHHKGSITISSSLWLRRTGYWLARLWLIECGLSERSVSSRRFAEMAAAALVQGVVLAVTRPKGTPEMARLGQARRAIMIEIAQIWRIVRERTAVLAVTLASLEFIGRIILSRIKTARKRRA